MPIVAVSASARDLAVLLAHGPRLAVEQVEGADGVPPQPQRDGVHGREALGERPLGEPRPAVGGGGQVRDGNRLARGEAVQAGAFVGLDLEQLQQPGLLGRGRDHLEPAALVGEQEPGRDGVEQADAVADELVQQLDDVVVVDQGVGHLDEGAHQLRLALGRQYLLHGRVPLCARLSVELSGHADRTTGHGGPRSAGLSLRFTTSSATSSTRRPTE
jgi:hypothetical protein